MIKFFFICLFLFAGSASAEIYQWTDANGRVHFGDKPAKNVKAKAVKVEVNTYTNVSYENLDYKDEDKNTHSKKVIMYSTSWCSYCKKARSYFVENGISFVDYDIENDKNAKRAYDALGAKGVPVIVVGKKRMNGFSVAGFKTLLSSS
ncbi:MAG: glutaredoxin family protein [Pseudomonadota bacterium]